MRFGALALVLLGLLGLLGASADAKPERQLLVAGARDARDARAVAKATPIAARRAFASLEAAGWRAIWDRDTGVPLQMWGSFVAVPGAVRDPAIAERAARRFLAAHLDLLAPGADFVVSANQLDGDVRTVGFRQTANGLAVVGGQLGFVFAHDRLFAIGSEALPNVRVAPPRPRAAAGVILARAEAWVASDTAQRVRATALGDRVILPIVFAGSPIEYHVVDVVDVTALDAPGRWDVYVGDDGAAIARRNRIATATGTLDFNAGIRYASGARMDFPAPDVGATVDGTPATTGDDGTFTWPGSASATVVPSVTGSHVVVINQAGAMATASLMAQPGEPVAWNAATVEFDDSQISTYIYGNIARARDLIVNPAITAWLEGPLNFYVNETGTCNAFSTGDEVHLFRADAMCENTGRLADVVFHEFGHSVHNHSIIPGMGVFDIPMSEGLADFNAANINEDSGVGRGFYYSNAPLRDIDPPGVERVWPADQNADPHITGEIISGALWDLRKALIRALGHDAGVTQAEKIFTGIMQRAADIPSTYMAALIADDDDGDLGNGTPHYCALRQAFGVHGLAEADFTTTTVSPPTLDGLAISVATATPAADICTPPNVTAISVTWQVGDAVPSTFALVPQGDTWSGAFPPQPEGTIITYAVDAELGDGSSFAFPDNPADPMYQLFVGTATPIWCELMNADPHWAQTGTLGTEWDFGVPGSNPASSDPTFAHTGVDVLGTNVAGSGFYNPNDSTSIEPPMIDVSSFAQVHLQYWRWLTVEDSLYDQATIVINDTQVWINATGPGGTLDHVDKEWRFHDIDLTQYVASGVAQLQWTLASDFSEQLGGWNLDDVCVVGLTKRAICGDGVLDEGEQCDDHNLVNGDGCSSTCTYELTAGGGCSAGGEPGAVVLAPLGVLLLRRRRR